MMWHVDFEGRQKNHVIGEEFHAFSAWKHGRSSVVRVLVHNMGSGAYMYFLCVGHGVILPGILSGLHEIVRL